MALTRLAHSLVRNHFLNTSDEALRPTKRLAIDATCGNGHDTEFLARLGFDKVLGFDVQATAISNTSSRLENAQIENVSLHHCGHQFMQQYLDGEISCVMFNFGYLPKADKAVTTMSNTSISALNVALENLQADGLICLICYPGHSEGMIETQAIKTWLASIKAPWQVKEYLAKSPKPEAPILYTLSQ